MFPEPFHGKSFVSGPSTCQANGTVFSLAHANSDGQHALLVQLIGTFNGNRRKQTRTEKPAAQFVYLSSVEDISFFPGHEAFNIVRINTRRPLY